MKKKIKWKVGEGEKVRGVKDGDTVRIYQAGEILPDGYEPPKSYIDQKIVKEA